MATPPRLSRVLPAVLYNIVPDNSYTDFCNKIDSLLILAAADYKIRAYRSTWSNYGYLFWLFWFLVCYIVFIHSMFNDTSIPDRYFIIAATSVIICIIFTVTVRFWMKGSTGVTPATQTILEIREECEAMTNRTPHASFHVVLTALATALRGRDLLVNPIAYIEVSVSVIGFELAKTNVGLLSTDIRDGNGNNTANISHPAVNSTSPVTNNYQTFDEFKT